MFYQPVQSHDRYFARDIRYVEINWTVLGSVIEAFRARIEQWYIAPANTLALCWHNAFSVAALDCLLIDTLAQFEHGADKSSASVFIDFVKAKWPQFASPLPANIRRDPKNKKGKIKDITNPAEALYYGFRCGILHEAHIPPYCQMDHEPNIVRTAPSGTVRYKDGSDCCAVILDPVELLKSLELNFNCYIESLLDANSKYEKLRSNFKKKFRDSFGICIDAAR